VATKISITEDTMQQGTVVTRDSGKLRYGCKFRVKLPDGTWKQQWKAFATHRAAVAFLNKTVRQVEDGVYSPSSNLTFEQFADHWLDKYPKSAPQMPKPSTIQGHRSICQRHLKPFFGRMRLSNITSVSISKDFREHLGRNLKQNTLRNIYMVLRRMLESAVQWDLISSNPFTSGKRVKSPTTNKEQHGRALTKDEAKKLIDTCSGMTQTVVRLALFTGMRRGEIFGLEWDDVDFDQNVINVRRSIFIKHGKLWKADEKGIAFTPPKSKHSERAIDIGPALRKELLEYKLKTGRSKGLVFVTSAGTPFDPKNFFSRYFIPAVETAGIGPLRFHDLRHTFGSWLINDGRLLTYVQRQLGHGSIAVTSDIYGHLLTKPDPEAAARLEEGLF
jgi:integrase